MKLVAIPSLMIGQQWPELRPGVAKVLKRSLGLYTEADILAKVESGEWLVFAHYENQLPVVVLVASLRTGSGGDVFDVGMCWGTRLHEWIGDTCKAFESIARECGCKYLAFSGRPGWRRLAAKHDFTINSMTFSKELTQ